MQDTRISSCFNLNRYISDPVKTLAITTLVASILITLILAAGGGAGLWGLHSSAPLLMQTIAGILKIKGAIGLLGVSAVSFGVFISSVLYLVTYKKNPTPSDPTKDTTTIEDPKKDQESELDSSDKDSKELDNSEKEDQELKSDTSIDDKKEGQASNSENHDVSPKKLDDSKLEGDHQVRQPAADDLVDLRKFNHTREAESEATKFLRMNQVCIYEVVGFPMLFWRDRNDYGYFSCFRYSDGTRVCGDFSLKYQDYINASPKEAEQLKTADAIYAVFANAPKFKYYTYVKDRAMTPAKEKIIAPAQIAPPSAERSKTDTFDFSQITPENFEEFIDVSQKFDFNTSKVGHLIFTKKGNFTNPSYLIHLCVQGSQYGTVAKVELGSWQVKFKNFYYEANRYRKKNFSNSKEFFDALFTETNLFALKFEFLQIKTPEGKEIRYYKPKHEHLTGT